MKKQRGRPKGSKNKPKAKAVELCKIADYFATIFIAQHHVDGAERLAELILQKIRAQKV